MSAATNDTLGQVVLSGDLAGTGETPELRATGVTPGTYSLAQMVIDAKGRTIFARTPTWKQVEPYFTIASYTGPGIFKVGKGLHMVAGIGWCGQLTANIATQDGREKVTTKTETVTISDCGVETVTSTSTDSFVTVPGIFGTAKLGDGVIDDGLGNVKISVPNATPSTFGLIKLGSGIESYTGTGYDGVINRTGFQLATSSSFGMVKVEPTSSVGTRNALEVFDGVLSFNTIPSSTRYGISKVNTDANNFGIFLDTDKVHMFLAGNFGWGYLGNSFFASGSPLSISSDGTLSYAGAGSLPIASDTVLGKIQVGGGLSVTDDGTLSLTNLKPATTTELGTVKPDNNTITVNGSGVISASVISTTQLGVVQFAVNEFVTLNVSGHQTNGGWRPNRANVTNQGVVLNGNTSEINIIEGIVSLKDPIVRKNVPNTFTGSQVTALEDFTASTSTYTPDFAAGNVKQISINHNDVTIENPTNVVNGTVIQMIIKKSDDNHTFSFGSAYKLNSTLNTSFTAAQALLLSCICISSSVILVIQGDVITL